MPMLQHPFRGAIAAVTALRVSITNSALLSEFGTIRQLSCRGRGILVVRGIPYLATIPMSWVGGNVGVSAFIIKLGRVEVE